MPKIVTRTLPFLALVFAVLMRPEVVGRGILLFW